MSGKLLSSSTLRDRISTVFGRHYLFITESMSDRLENEVKRSTFKFKNKIGKWFMSYVFKRCIWFNNEQFLFETPLQDLTINFKVFNSTWCQSGLESIKQIIWLNEMNEVYILLKINWRKIFMFFSLFSCVLYHKMSEKTRKFQKWSL